MEYTEPPKCQLKHHMEADRCIQEQKEDARAIRRPMIVREENYDKAEKRVERGERLPYGPIADPRLAVLPKATTVTTRVERNSPNKSNL